MAKVAKKAKKKSASSKAPVVSRGQALDPFTSLRSEIDRVFDAFAHGVPWAHPDMRSLWDMRPFSRLGTALGGAFQHVPSADLTETDKAYELSVELPGLEEKDVELSLSDDVLVLEAERKHEEEREEKDYHLSERAYGSFRRAFRMPEDVDADKVSAGFDKGVLTVRMPKSEKAKAKGRKIPVGGG